MNEDIFITETVENMRRSAFERKGMINRLLHKGFRYIISKTFNNIIVNNIKFIDMLSYIS